MRPFEGILLNKPLREIIRDNRLFAEELPFDEYHLVMAQTDVMENMCDIPAVKTVFYRTPPFGASYAVAAGLSSFLNRLDSFSYKALVPYLEEKGYGRELIKYVSGRDKLKVRFYSVPENSVVFPYEPMAILETTLIDSRILEGMVLADYNFSSLSASKWHRIKNAALGRPVMEFGRRRAQDGLRASLYSYVAGIDSTSNCEANRLFGIPSSGTMGHEFVQSIGDEFEAFDRWLARNPSKPCLLIDTVNTVESGIVNACLAFKKHETLLRENGSWNKIGFRIDSGDLAYLASVCYDYASKELATENISVVLSNDLDENSMEAILSQLFFAGRKKVIDHLSFGVGTRGAVAWGEPALGGVCKVSEIGGSYILKISNNNVKTTIPGNLRSSLVKDAAGAYVTTLIYFKDEDPSKITRYFHPNDDSKFLNVVPGEVTLTPKQFAVYESNGTESSFIGRYPHQSLTEIRNNSETVLDSLDWSYKRTVSPHRAKVSLSPEVFEIRWKMIRSGMISMPK